MPTLQALAHLPVRVLATTGGRATEALMEALPGNARVREFISFGRWLPETALLITNGGYGSINYALDCGVPLIVAGTGEDKLEAAARVVAAGCGISLHTSTPTAEQIPAATMRILQQPIYRQRAALVREDYARHDALTAIANEVPPLLPDLAVLPSSGAVFGAFFCIFLPWKLHDYVQSSQAAKSVEC